MATPVPVKIFLYSAQYRLKRLGYRARCSPPFHWPAIHLELEGRVSFSSGNAYIVGRSFLNLFLNSC